MPLLLDELATGKDDVLAVQVDLENLEVVGLADVLIEVLGRLDVDMRGRQEGVDPDADDEASLHLGLHAPGDDRAFGALLENVFPVLLLLRQVVGDDGVAVFVLQLFQDHLDLRPDLHLAQIAEFRGRDDAFGLAANIDDNFVLTDFGDDAGDNRAFLQFIEGALREQFLHD